MKKEKITDKVKSNANHSNTYDDVFQSLKANHTKLFIPLINFKFNKNYSLDEAFELLPTDEYITNTTQSDEQVKRNWKKLRMIYTTSILSCRIHFMNH